MDRLLCFLVPVAALLVAAGMDALLLRSARIPRVAKLCACLAALFFPVVRQGAALITPARCEEVRPVLKELAKLRQPGDRIYVYYGARAAFEYYAPRLGIPADGVVLGNRSRHHSDGYKAELSKLRGSPRVWYLASHVRSSEGQFLQKTLLEWGSCEQKFRSTGAIVMLFDLSKPHPQAASADKPVNP